MTLSDEIGELAPTELYVYFNILHMTKNKLDLTRAKTDERFTANDIIDFIWETDKKLYEYAKRNPKSTRFGLDQLRLSEAIKKIKTDMYHDKPSFAKNIYRIISNLKSNDLIIKFPFATVQNGKKTHLYNLNIRAINSMLKTKHKQVRNINWIEFPVIDNAPGKIKKLIHNLRYYLNTVAEEKEEPKKNRQPKHTPRIGLTSDQLFAYHNRLMGIQKWAIKNDLEIDQIQKLKRMSDYLERLFQKFTKNPDRILAVMESIMKPRFGRDE
jgi:hypothetical protein